MSVKPLSRTHFWAQPSPHSILVRSNSIILQQAAPFPKIDLVEPQKKRQKNKKTMATVVDCLGVPEDPARPAHTLYHCPNEIYFIIIPSATATPRTGPYGTRGFRWWCVKPVRGRDLPTAWGWRSPIEDTVTGVSWHRFVVLGELFMIMFRREINSASEMKIRIVFWT